MTPPNRQTTAGRMFLDLRRLAQTTSRTTDELLQLYALEGLLDRLTQSDQRDHFILKGGVLLAAYKARRATRDVDFAAREISNDIDTMVEAIRAIFAVHIDDGLVYNPESLRAQIIREDDDYSGVRITATAQLATARLHFHLDINVGDPIWSIRPWSTFHASSAPNLYDSSATRSAWSSQRRSSPPCNAAPPTRDDATSSISVS